MGVWELINCNALAVQETQNTADDLTRLIDTANAPIFGIDTSGNVTEWNRMAASVSG